MFFAVEWDFRCGGIVAEEIGLEIQDPSRFTLPRSTGCVYANFGLTVVVVYFASSFWISFGSRGNNLEFFLFYFLFNRIFKKGLLQKFRKVEVEVERMKSTIEGYSDN